MSEQVQVSVVTGGVALLTALLTLIVTMWFNSRSQSKQQEERLKERREDYREWYSRTLFEKRLAVAQEAYKWVMRFNVAISRADPQNPESEGSKALRQTSEEAREWYDNNNIYLHDDLPGSSAFIGLTNTAYTYGSGKEKPRDIWGKFREADKMIGERVKKLFKMEHGQRNEQ